MDSQVQAALVTAAEAAGAVSPEVVACFPNLTVEDPAGIPEAIAYMQKKAPGLFKPTDFAKMDKGQQANVEARLRKPTARPERRLPQGLDYSLLSAQEFEAVDRYLSGRSNDDTTLSHVAAKQGLS